MSEKKLFYNISRYRGTELMGNYIQPKDKIHDALDGELFDWADVDENERLEIRLVEMTDEEYNALPEFAGY